MSRVIVFGGRSEETSGKMWHQTASLYDVRYVVQRRHGPANEFGFLGGHTQLYAAALNTIYVNESLGQPYTLRPARRPGSYVLTVNHVQSVTITAAQATAIRNGDATIDYEGAAGVGRPIVVPRRATGSPPFNFAGVGRAHLLTPPALGEAGPEP